MWEAKEVLDDLWMAQPAAVGSHGPDLTQAEQQARVWGPLSLGSPEAPGCSEKNPGVVAVQSPHPRLGQTHIPWWVWNSLRSASARSSPGLGELTFINSIQLDSSLLTVHLLGPER